MKDGLVGRPERMLRMVETWAGEWRWKGVMGLNDILEERCLDTAESLVVEKGYFAIVGHSERCTSTKTGG